jgi:hypothetical protein
MAADFIHALGNFGNFSNYALHRAFQRTGDSSDERFIRRAIHPTSDSSDEIRF